MSVPCTHPVRGRFNAWLLDVMDGYLEHLLGARKRRLLVDLPPELVEIGPGTGANFRHYPRGTRVIAIEPNVCMHERLKRRAAKHGITLDLRGLKGEALDLPDASVDLVVGTLVLCTVDDPNQVLAEVRRVLRPGGRFVFVEHIAAQAGSGLRRLQEAVHGPWHWCFEGCNTQRETDRLIEEAGFREVRMERYRLRSPFLPVNPQIAGVAVK